MSIFIPSSSSSVTTAQLAAATNQCVKKTALTLTGASNSVLETTPGGNVCLGGTTVTTGTLNVQGGPSAISVFPLTDQAENSLQFSARTAGTSVYGGDRFVLGHAAWGAGAQNLGIGCNGPGLCLSIKGQDNSGNVGIHKANATVPLDVNGAGAFSGNLAANGGLALNGQLNVPRVQAVGMNNTSVPVNYGDTSTQFMIFAGASGVASCLALVNTNKCTCYFVNDSASPSNLSIGLDGTGSINFKTGMNISASNIATSGATQMTISPSAITCNLPLALNQNASMAGKWTAYNGITTAGLGMPVLVFESYSGTLTNTSGIYNFAPPVSTTEYMIIGYVSVTSYTSGGTNNGFSLGLSYYPLGSTNTSNAVRLNGYGPISSVYGGQRDASNVVSDRINSVGEWAPAPMVFRCMPGNTLNGTAGNVQIDNYPATFASGDTYPVMTYSCTVRVYRLN